MKKEKAIIIAYKTSCSLCGKKFVGVDKNKLSKEVVKHIDNECKTAKDMKSWEEKGIFKEMMVMIRVDVIRKDVKKLLKSYTIEEIRKALEDIEIEEIDKKLKCKGGN